MSRFQRVDPCTRCGWVWRGFHVCAIDFSDPKERSAAQEVVLAPYQRVKRAQGPMSEEQKAKISQTQSERWQRYRAENAARDAKIVERYNEGDISQPQLALTFGVSKTTINKVLKEAQAEGLTEIRGVGRNIRFQTG